MTYKDNFVAVVKCNGSILREQNGAVKMSFGSEYHILLKNLDSRRVQVNVTIDGQDVLDGNQIIVEGNSSTELEGFMDGSVAKNQFKFIKKTQKIVEHRGDKVDDGLIRIEYQFEKRLPETVDIEHHHHYHGSYLYPWYGDWRPWYPYWETRPTITYSGSGSGGSLSGLTHDSGEAVVDTLVQSVSSYNCSVEPQINADEGITAHGSQVNQQFSSTYMGELENNSSVIIIKLIGTDSKGISISKPITVKTKLECPTCGTKSKSSVKYCGECGTFLI